eukprot:tig00020554_g10802.t1
MATADRSQRSVFSIVGLPPEVLAVAMAKYSRSVESIVDTIDELSEEKSAQFHEKWVLGYGDASVADMAVVAIALENVSILASKAVEDNRIASYQEKSTRYVQFDLDRFYRPPSVIALPKIGERYSSTVAKLFSSYERVSELMRQHYRSQYPRGDQSEGVYETRIKARSFDVSRYLLPTATLTNFGMIMSARSLRHAISKLKASPVEEIRAIGEEVQRAAVEPAYNPLQKKLEPLFSELATAGGERAKEIGALIQKTVKLQIAGAPTLVKRTEPKQYLADKDKAMREFAVKYLGNIGEPDRSYRVDLIESAPAPEDELIATLLYSASEFGFRQILRHVQQLSQEEKREIINAVQEKRSQWDWPSREFEVGQGFIFDTLMDYGAFRDLQRHRICTQINQPLGISHGYETPRDIQGEALNIYNEAMNEAASTFRAIAEAGQPAEAAYVIPLGYRKRTLFKMNLREMYHIVELRTKPGGHFSYRDLVYELFEQFRKQHPLLAEHMRAVKNIYEEDFFKR